MNSDTILNIRFWSDQVLKQKWCDGGRTEVLNIFTLKYWELKSRHVALLSCSYCFPFKHLSLSLSSLLHITTIFLLLKAFLKLTNNSASTAQISTKKVVFLVVKVWVWSKSLGWGWLSFLLWHFWSLSRKKCYKSQKEKKEKKKRLYA